MMKVGDLVYFSSKHLAYDFDQLRGQYGLLLEYMELPGRGDKVYPSWEVLWGEKTLIVYEQDITKVNQHDF